MLTKSILALAAVVGGVNAQAFPSSAPTCVTRCFTIKISEAGSLAPGVNPSNIAGLCAVPTFIQAYVNCLNDNCGSPSNVTTGIALGQQVCASVGVAIPTAGYTGAASSQLASLTPIPLATTSAAGAGANGSATTTPASASATGSSSVSGVAGVPVSSSVGNASSAASGASSSASMTAASGASGATSSASGGGAASSASSAVGVATSAVGGAASSASSTAHASAADKVVATGLLGFVAGLLALIA